MGFFDEYMGGSFKVQARPDAKQPKPAKVFPAMNDLSGECLECGGISDNVMFGVCSECEGLEASNEA